MQPEPFIPSGVNAHTWMGFEQKVRDRRLQGLVDAVDEAIACGDVAGALSALDEARELDPVSPAVAAASERVAALHIQLDPDPAAAALYAWPRIIGAVALLLVGVSLLMGIDWLRTPPPIPAAPSVAAPPLLPLGIPVSEPVAVATTGTVRVVAPAPKTVRVLPRAAKVVREPAERSRTAAAKVRRPPASSDTPRLGGWKRVLKPTTRFLTSTLPKILTSPI